MFDDIDYEKWLLDNYTFYEDIFEDDGSCYLEFCLKEEAISFISLCSEIEVPFTYCPPYGVAISILHLKNLIRVCELEKKDGINQKILSDCHPLLKLH